MSDKEFAARVKRLADMSDMSNDDKKNFSLLVAYACDTEEHEKKVCNYLEKDGISFKSLIDYVTSILPPIDIVDD